MPEKNQVYTAEITSLTNEGSGVCRIDGMAVFVPGTAAGDVAEIKVVKVLSHYAFGILQKIITPSPDRIENDCPVFKQCGGCVFRHISYDAEVRAKDDIVRDAFRRIGGLDPVFDEFISADQTDRYRNKGQFPLAKVDGNAVCGFFAPRSHSLIPAVSCPNAMPLSAEIAHAFLLWMKAFRISPYQEETGSGTVRHLVIRINRKNKAMVTVVINAPSIPHLDELRSVLEPLGVISLYLNVNRKNTNVILSDQFQLISGSETIE
ncbi:MAG: class I SAM-dependent RNA methyltransferase, partial [Ruminococcus sp.]|nr:class I SAM-dependent RNA methyltransferase [Ruminococcus sp.]